MKYLFIILIILNFNLVFAVEDNLYCRLSTPYIVPEVTGEDVPKEVEILYELKDYDYVTVYIKDEEKVVYNLLKNNYQNPGVHRVKWSGKNTTGGIVKNGEYTVEVSTKSGLKRNLYIKVVDLIAKVSLPAENSLVRADVPVWGLACGKDFEEFRLEYGEGINPEKWILINKSEIQITTDVQPVDLSPERQPLKGNLGTWETGLTNYYYKDYDKDLKGIYTLRLVVNDTKGNSVEDKKIVEVGNVVTNVFGGVVESIDNKVRLSFEEHSLYESFLVVSIKPLDKIDIDMPYDLIGKVYEFRPAGTGFVKQGVLEMQYDPEMSRIFDENKFGIYIYNDKREWEYTDTIIDKDNKRLIAKVDYLSKPRSYYAVFYNPDIPLREIADKEIERIDKETKGSEYFTLDSFEEDSEGWKAWEGTVLERDVYGDNSHCLKLVNNEWGGYFGVTVSNEGFNANEFPILEFDYKISPEVKINVLVKVSGRWYDILFTDNPKQYLRINMKKLSEIEDVKADGNWHHARVNLVEGLQKYTNESFVEKIIFADFDSNGYMELKPGLSSKGITCYIDNFCIRRANMEECAPLKGICYTSWRIGEDDGTNDDLAYERFEGQFKDSETDDDFYIGDPQGEFERAVAFDDGITNVYFFLDENEAGDKYLFYIDVIDCDLREHDYVKFGVYINDELVDTYSCYLKKGQLYVVPIDKCLESGKNKITIKWIEGGNWISWDYVAFQPLQYKEEIRVLIKKDKIYVNGEEFLVKGIGYSPYRPGELPWGKRPSLQTMENDFKLIKEAGFNALRTWMPLTENELLIARQCGLMVLQGVWLDPVADPLRDTKFQTLSPFISKELQQLIKRFSKSANILMYLVGNEIPIDSIYRVGLLKTEKMFRNIKEIAKDTDSRCRISFANWPQVLFLDNSMWDAVAYNIYSYYPAIISHSMSYYGFLEWVKNSYAHNKPFIVTEYGLSVSNRGPGNFGYGGNTVEQQKEAIISMWDDIIQAGASGGCLFEWNDEWWKNYEFIGDEKSHNNEPEEWFGILGIEGTSDDNYTEKLRPAYYAIKEYNQAIIVEPNKYKFYKKSIPIKVYIAENVCNLRYKIDDSDWGELRHISTHWWKGEWKSNDKEIKPHILNIEAIGKDGEIICKKQMKFWAGLSTGIKEPRYFISIDCKDNYICDGKLELIKVLFKVVDENKRPIRGISIKYSFYETRLWEQVSGEKITDENGFISVDYYIREPGYIIIAAGVDYKYKEFVKRFGAIRFIEILPL